MANLDTDQGTPEHWLEPIPGQSAAAGSTAEAPATPDRRVSRAALAGFVLATSVVGAALGAGGTVLLLRQSGERDPGAAAARATSLAVTGRQVRSDPAAVAQAIRAVGPAVVTIVAETENGTETGVGSGIVYDSQGWILTNEHLVRGATRLEIRLRDGREFAATLYGADAGTDLAIVKAGSQGLPVAPMGDSDSVEVGQPAIVIGSPSGAGRTETIAEGIVSALGGSVSIRPAFEGGPGAGVPTNVLRGLIQTDAAGDAANSGGPLVDASGRVIGINTAGPAGAGGSLAIPIDVAKPIMQQALAGEPLSRPWLGVVDVPIDREVQTANHLPLDHGAWIHAAGGPGKPGEPGDAIVPGGPAALAGVRAGDIVTAVEDQPVGALHPLDDVLTRFAPGRTVSLQVYRGGRYLTIRVTLEALPASGG